MYKSLIVFYFSTGLMIGCSCSGSTASNSSADAGSDAPTNSPDTDTDTDTDTEDDTSTNARQDTPFDSSRDPALDTAETDTETATQTAVSERDTRHVIDGDTVSDDTHDSDMWTDTPSDQEAETETESDSGADSDTTSDSLPNTDDDTDTGEMGGDTAETSGDDLPVPDGGMDAGDGREPDSDSGPYFCRYHVKETATGAGDGSSWEDATSDLQAAIDGAALGVTDQMDHCEVWVAGGNYAPDPGADRESSFYLKDNVWLYGGFGDGTETSLEARNLARYRSMLNGELNNPSSTFDRYHVIRCEAENGCGPNTRLDGFSITNGDAIDYHDDDVTLKRNQGGGMYAVGAVPVIANCVFHGNAARSGAGLYVIGVSELTIVETSFVSNRASGGAGGGMYIGAGAAVLLDDIYVNGCESTTAGGGIFVGTSREFILTEGIFTNNFTSREGGAIQFLFDPDTAGTVFLANARFENNRGRINGGAISSVNAPFTLANALFTENSADYGGAVHLVYAPGTTITGGTFFYNRSYEIGGAIFNGEGSTLSIYNSILWRNLTGGRKTDMYNDLSIDPNITVTLQDNILTQPCDEVDGAVCVDGNIEANPLFQDDDPSDDDISTLLRACSPAIDTGDVSHLPLDFIDYDLDNDTEETSPLALTSSRVLDGDGSGEAVIDLGFFEYRDELCGYVTPDVPELISPEEGQVFFDCCDEDIMYEWESVRDSIGYEIDIEYCHPNGCGADSWPFEGNPFFTETNTFQMNFVGTQPGRWRVRAVGENKKSAYTSWRGFEYR